MMITVIPGQDRFAGHLREDSLLAASPAAPGSPSFEWMLREGASNAAHLASISFEATGTLGFEHPAPSAQAAEQAGDLTSPPQAATQALPPVVPRAGAEQVPSTRPHEEAGPRSALMGTTPSAASMSSPSASGHETPLREGAHPLGMRLETAAQRVSVPNGKPASIPPELTPASDAPSGSATRLAPPPALPHLSVTLEATEGAILAYATLPVWARDDIAELRVRARYLLSAYHWADNTLHIRETGPAEPRTDIQENNHGR